MAWSSDEYLAHHGILGQRWGHQNGPPYPLGSGDHSASEKKAGWRKSLKKEKAQRKKEKRALSEHEKAQRRNMATTALGLGAGAATAAMIFAQNKETGRTTTHKPASSYITKDGNIDKLRDENSKLAAIQTYNKLTGNKDRLEAAIDNTGKFKQQIEGMKNSIKVPKYEGPTHKRMNLDDMSDDDMRKIINREKLEIEYSNMFGEKIEPVKSGEEKVKEFLDIAGGVAAAAGTALTLALMIKGLKEGTKKAAEAAK